MQQQVAHLAQVASRLDSESSSLLQLGLSPFKGHHEKTEILKSGMKDSLLTGALRKNPEVREAVRKALARRSRLTEPQSE